MNLTLSDVKQLLYLIDQVSEPERFARLQKRLEDHLVKLTS